MSNKITFPELIDLVAQAASTSKRVSELFLKELFATITQSLVEGDSVKVKGLGTFKLTNVSSRRSVNVNTGESIEIPGHKKLSFVPDKELADAVNRPFAQFETVVLSDAVTDEQLNAIDRDEPATTDDNDESHNESDSKEETTTQEETVTAAPAAEPNVEEEKEAETPASPEAEHNAVAETSTVAESSTVVETPPPFTAPVVETPPVFKQPQPATHSNTAETTETPATLEPQPAQQPAPEVVQGLSTDEVAEIERRAKRKGFAWGVAAAVVVAVVAMIAVHGTAIFKGNSSVKPSDTTAVQQPVKSATATQVDPAKPDTAAAQAQDQPKAATPQVVLDTTSTRNVLTRMAQRHYGKQCFWVYIYLENKDKIKNPNNIPDGTVLVIPPKEKYGIDASSKASIDKASKKAMELEKN